MLLSFEAAWLHYTCLDLAYLAAWHLTVQPCIGTGHSDNDTDFISALTGLFKDIATAVEENHDLLLTNFGATFLVEFTLGLQAECDVQVCHLKAWIMSLCALSKFKLLSYLSDSACRMCVEALVNVHTHTVASSVLMRWPWLTYSLTCVTMCGLPFGHSHTAAGCREAVLYRGTLITRSCSG